MTSSASTLFTNKSQIIKCHYCQAQYLAGEIYFPGALTGQPDEIVKDCDGRIIYEDYYSETKQPDMTEHFTCEYCGKPFVVTATVTYKTKEESPENDFSEKYVALLD